MPSTTLMGYAGHPGVMWPRDPPTPPRARPYDDFPMQRAVPQPSQASGRQALDSGGHYFNSFQSKADCGNMPDQMKARPATSTRRPRCDKCDEAHETQNCPHFRQARDKHADAWSNYHSASPSKGPKAFRECSAPRNLSHHAVRVVRVPGDGSCLFHSIAYGLGNLGFREDGHRIRQRVANFIAENPEIEISGTPLRSWVQWDSQMTVQDYASRIYAGGTWGGGVDMAACSQIYSVDVAVYEEDSYYGYRRISDFLTDVKPRGAVLLLYSGRSHYDALHIVSYGGRVGTRELPDHYSPLGHQPGGEDDDAFCSMM